MSVSEDPLTSKNNVEFLYSKLGDRAGRDGSRSYTALQ
jgi:hypothetical protein